MYKDVQGVEKIMQTLRNWGIECICVGYIESTSVGNTECSSICLHYVVLVSVHWWLYWVIARVKEWENGRLVRFWKRADRWCAFSWGICDKTATILGVSRAIVSKTMSAAYTSHRKTTSAKRNSGRKSTVTERGRRTLRIVSKNHRTTAAQVTGQQNWIFILKTLFPKHLCDVNFTIQHPQQGCNC
jgi:hypothetical protein